MAQAVPPMIAVDARDLRNALNVVLQVIERRNTIPILGTVRITAYPDRISLRGTDLDLEVEIIVPAETEGTFDVTLPPRWLHGNIQWYDGLVTIRQEARGGGTIITVEAGDLWAETRLLSPVDDWPAVIGTSKDVIAGEGWTNPVAIAEAALKRALDAVQASISTEPTRYYLNGAYAVAVDGEMRLVSTDGHRLSLYDTGAVWGGLGGIIPRKTVQVLARRMIAGGNADVQVSQLIRMVKSSGSSGKTKAKGAATVTDAEQPAEMVPWPAAMRFSGDGWSITSKMIDGTYPDYTRVLPQPVEDIAVTVSMEALRRFPNTGHGPRAVELNGEAGTMTYRGMDGDAVRLPLQGKGKPFGINLNYLKDFARRSGTIRLTGSNADNPFRVLSEDPRLLQVLMPMRI